MGHSALQNVTIVVLFFTTALVLLGSLNQDAFAQITITPGEKNVLSIDAGKRDGPFIHKINPITGATISSVGITLDGSFSPFDTVNGGTGIAFNPADGKIYALLKIPKEDRHLATIDPLTGVATLVGNTGIEKIASLTFNSGTLYSVNLSAGTLSTISTVDGSVVNLCDNRVFDGTGLAFNPDDGKLYYVTTFDFERIDNFNVAGSCVVTDIPTFGPSNPTALVFFNSFLLVQTSDLYSITDTGVRTFIATLDHFSRGLP